MILTRLVRRKTGKVWYRVMASTDEMVDAAQTLKDDFEDEEFVVSCVELADAADASPPWVKVGAT